jgi:meso-butanediol dehydrogenase/(S,S)-butanediol dehydrogenase/diacetyl reductase
MAGKLDGKVAVITGAASGIGAATARRFAQEGAKLVLSDLHEEEGRKVAQEVKAAAFVTTDVGEAAQVEALLQTAVDRCGALNIVVNNAGIGGYGKAPDLDIELWRKILSVDLDGVFYGCKYAIPHMRRAGGGAIVNTASVSGLFGDYGFLAYNAAKGAVVNLTRTVAIDHAKEGIRCNCVCPGAIDTAMFQQIAVIPGALDAYTQCIPMARVGRADEVAAAIAFLASDDASYITGVPLVIDGGVTAFTGQASVSRIIGD